MVSRHDLIYCENCSCVCYFCHELNRWVNKYQKPMFTQKHCSIECYHEILRELELEFTLNSEARTSIVRRLHMYKEMDKYRCKNCGSVSSWCHCMVYDENISRTVYKEDLNQLDLDQYIRKYIKRNEN